MMSDVFLEGNTIDNIQEVTIKHEQKIKNYALTVLISLFIDRPYSKNNLYDSALHIARSLLQKELNAQPPSQKSEPQKKELVGPKQEVTIRYEQKIKNYSLSIALNLFVDRNDTPEKVYKKALQIARSLILKAIYAQPNQNWRGLRK